MYVALSDVGIAGVLDLSLLVRLFPLFISNCFEKKKQNDSKIPNGVYSHGVLELR